METHAAGASDETLMSQLCSATDRETVDVLFNEVFTRYHARVVSWCYRLARDREAASDLAQEIFLKAYRHRRSFRGDSHLSTWLNAITRNHCLTAIRKRGQPALQLDPALLTGLRDTSVIDPDLAAERNEICRRMMQLMTRTLEPLELRVMTLHYGHEVPLAAITRELALENPSGAKAYIVNARRKLQGVLHRRGWKVLMGAARERQPEYWRGEVAA